MKSEQLTLPNTSETTPNDLPANDSPEFDNYYNANDDISPNNDDPMGAALEYINEATDGDQDALAAFEAEMRRESEEIGNRINPLYIKYISLLNKPEIDDNDCEEAIALFKEMGQHVEEVVTVFKEGWYDYINEWKENISDHFAEAYVDENGKNADERELSEYELAA